MIPIRDDNPTETFPWVTISLITANVLVFLYQLSLGSNSFLQQQFVLRFAMVPYQITHNPSGSPGSYFTILTAMFLHGGFLHIAFNMLYLWIFGNNVEDVLGHIRFLIFYLLCGLGGAAGHILSSPFSKIPSLGASGAIAGVLGAYLFLFPRARVLTLIPIVFFIEIVRIPAFIIIGFWFILQLLNGILSVTSKVALDVGGVAWFAHIGGFLTGFLLVLVFPKRRRPYA